MSKLLWLVLVLPLSAGDLIFTIKHVIENETIVETSDVNDGLESLRLIYKPDYKVDFGRRWSLALAADISYEAYYHVTGLGVDEAEIDQMETVFIMRNTNLKYKGNSFDATLGYQLPRFGFTTGVLPVIDVLNAQNRLSPFAQINNNPLSELMFRYDDYRSSRWVTSVFWVLGDQVDKVPVNESRFYGLPLPSQERQRDDLLSRDPELGIHTEAEFDQGRLGLTAMQIADNTGYYELMPDATLDVVHDVFQLYGVSYSHFFAQGSMHSDLAYSRDRMINGQPDATSLYVKPVDTLHGKVSYENNRIPNLTLKAGYSHLRILDPEPDLFFPRDNRLYEVGLAWELIDWDSILNLDVQKSEGRSLAVGSDAVTATASFAYIGINNLQLNLLARKVFRSEMDQPYETGFVLNAKYTF